MKIGRKKRVGRTKKIVSHRILLAGKKRAGGRRRSRRRRSRLNQTTSNLAGDVEPHRKKKNLEGRRVEKGVDASSCPLFSRGGGKTSPGAQILHLLKISNLSTKKQKYIKRQLAKRGKAWAIVEGKTLLQPE